MSVQFLAWVVEQFSQILSPLRTNLDTSAHFATLMQSYGWDVDPNSFLVTDVQTSLAIADDLTNAGQLLGQIYDPATSGTLDQYVQLVTILSDVVTKVRELASQSGAPNGISAAAWSDFAGALLDGLFEDYLESSWPALAAFLIMAGIITKTSVDLSGTPGRKSYVKKTIAWGDLTNALTQPGQLFAQTVSWNKAGHDFDFQQLLDRMNQALPLLGTATTLQSPSQVLLDAYYSSTNPARPTVKELLLSLLREIDPSSNTVLFDFAVSILPIPPRGQLDQKPVGFSLGPALTVGAGVPAASFGFFQLEFIGAFQADSGLRADVRPGDIGVTLATGVAPGGGTALDEEVVASSILGPPSILLGSRGSNRVQLDSWALKLKAVGSPTAPEVRLELALQNLALVVDFDDADSFLRTILGGGEQRVTLSLDVVWSSRTGLGFSGQAKLAATIPVHANILDVVTVDTLYAEIEAGTAGDVAAVLALTGGLHLGPIEASVDKIGVQARLKPTTADQPAGMFGNLDLQFGFKPPNGLGLAVDASVASGGGYIFFDPDKAEYGGVFVLALDLPMAAVQVNIAGILDTKLPGGQPGFSLLFLLVATFDPGFELGFGFTLDGVGGLVGINRSMALDPLRAAFKSHHLETIFFPPDPQTAIANAPQTISDLSSIFPVADGHTVFGPMLVLGWGTPLIISGEFGGVLELPTLRLALFGLFTVALPTIEVPEPSLLLVLLHIDILGEIDFDQDLLSIDGELFDSHIVEYSLSGEMAFRLSWGATKEFALSVGGLNPRFQPPPDFPNLQRLVISIGTSDVNLSLSLYLAQVSNTAQFGAELELQAAAAGFTVHGYLGFDALFTFLPPPVYITFVTDMRAGLDVLRGSTVLLAIDLDVTLTGPKPLHAHGEGKIHILFFDTPISFDKTWGEQAPAAALPTTAVWPLLQSALQDPQNWTTTLPSDTDRVFTLAKTRTGDQTLVVHPMGRLTVHEKVVPLDFQISLFGSASPGDYNAFQVLPPSLNGSHPDYDIQQDQFAPGQFETLSDDDKLSKPSYQPFDAIISFGSKDVKTGYASLLDVHYETYYVEDPNIPARTVKSSYRASTDTQLTLAGQGVTARTYAGSGKYVTPGVTSPISTSDTTYVIASTDTLQTNASLSVPGGTSQAAAKATLTNHLQTHPKDAGTLQVIPVFEAAAP